MGLPGRRMLPYGPFSWAASFLYFLKCRNRSRNYVTIAQRLGRDTPDDIGGGHRVRSEEARRPEVADGGSGPDVLALVPVVLVLCVMEAGMCPDNLGQRSADHLTVVPGQCPYEYGASGRRGALAAGRLTTGCWTVTGRGGHCSGAMPLPTIWCGSTGDQQFSMAAFWFNEDPEQMAASYNAGSYQTTLRLLEKDFPALQGLASRLDTYVAFCKWQPPLSGAQHDGPHFQAMGDAGAGAGSVYYFDNPVLPWAESVRLELGRAHPRGQRGGPSAGESWGWT